MVLSVGLAQLRVRSIYSALATLIYFASLASQTQSTTAWIQLQYPHAEEALPNSDPRCAAVRSGLRDAQVNILITNLSIKHIINALDLVHAYKLAQGGPYLYKLFTLRRECTAQVPAIVVQSHRLVTTDTLGEGDVAARIILPGETLGELLLLGTRCSLVEGTLQTKVWGPRLHKAVSLHQP